ncbi:MULTISPECIES: glycosyltransferase family 4 protein [Arthrobacter]|uniref:Glycosyltransferase n=1 Tax=Arthrobacter terricola TaxID=2547396 RepID=A0A4R5KBZ5_9MICC|nr:MULTISPECIES: glycosyltransferase family 4 protein [Arthrobacter]MBT8162731.1 glycosyltransferase family 4 protein [Arthrobacter sp. GN70]TDF92105.1 glycosyltransferase [Arthrobacter terricola]
MVAIRFIVPGNVRHGSGGNTYNAKLARGLTALGASVEMRAVDGDWPVGRPADRRRLAGAFDGATTVIADGLVAWGAPAEIAEATRRSVRVWILSHMGLPEHHELESQALKAATGVICTSSFAAADLAERHPEEGSGKVVVARPGTEHVAVAHGSDPLRIVCVAALLPNKEQLLLVEALGRLRALPWTAAFVGSDDADPAYAAKVRAAVVRSGLEHRITVTGELSGPALEEQWRAADLSVLVSRSESFGMVVVESLAHAVPALVRDGTGAVEALGGSGAGKAIAIGDDPEPLVQALDGWLRDAALRRKWRTAALRARDGLPGWDSTASIVLDACAVPL